MALISASEVVTAAFNRTVNSAYILDADINSAEYKFIRPALTENFYEYVVANPASFATLLTTYLKPCLAYYIKYSIYDELCIELSNRGGFQLQAENATPISSATRSDAKESVLVKARTLEEKMIDYIKKQKKAGNALFTLYNDFTSVDNEDQLIGGFLIEGGDSSEDEDE